MKLLSGIAIVLIASGCVSAKVQRMDEVPRPQRSPDEVQVLFQEPDRPYTVIAVVESKAESVFDGIDDLHQKLIAEAARLGGDAVIMGTEGREPTFLITAVGQVHSEKKTLNGTVIVFSPPLTRPGESVPDRL